MVAELSHDNRALKNPIEIKLYRQRVNGMQSITWLAMKQYRLRGLVLIWGWLGPHITNIRPEEPK
jgi:hypothetical protein